MTSRMAIPDTSRSRLNRLMTRMAVSVVIPTMLAMSCLVILTVRRIPFRSLIPIALVGFGQFLKHARAHRS
jgi:hypothetical protein